MRIALSLEYDGSGYAGWQSQPHGNTVQDQLEQALSAIAGMPIRCNCAGRTDAGVHALGQVVHFDSPVQRPMTAWTRGVNAHLPADIAVVWATPVSDAFHARFSAESRRYRYVLLNRPVRPALAHGRAGWYHARLCVDAMAEASHILLGEHDFSAFRSSECQAKSPIKTMRGVLVARQGDTILFDFSANAFLHHMVRNLVAALIEVGKGRADAQWLAGLLKARDRRLSPGTFDAAGLYFIGPSYPAHLLSIPEPSTPETRIMSGPMSFFE